MFGFRDANNLVMVKYKETVFLEVRKLDLA